MKLFLALYLFIKIVSSFEIYWNVPTIQCKKYNLGFVDLLRTYGILVNDGDEFKGEKVTIFYDKQIGLYPHITKSGEMKNGGIPQRGDLAKHLYEATKNIEAIIPSNDFNGLGIIDWEAWRPSWAFNWYPLDIYRKKSREFAKELNPTLNDTAINAVAEYQWTKSARYYMLETLNLAKRMRPHGRWCYYLFPDCYNYVGKVPKDFQCSAKIRKENDKLEWLWKGSTAICPSIYVHSPHLDRYTFEQRSWRDNWKIREAQRVASKTDKIYPYVNYFHKDFVPKEDIWRMLAQTAAAGSDGAVIWGPSKSLKSKNQCTDLKNLIISTLGPAAEMVAWRSNLCSNQICNGRGRCTWPNDDSAEAWKLFLDNTNKTFYAGGITCRCSENYNGRFCEQT